MSGNPQFQQDSGGFLFGLLAGLGLGLLAAILLAPRSGRESQLLLGDFLTDVSSNMDKSKDHYRDVLKKTQYDIEDKFDQFKEWKDARKMAKAKRKESNDNPSNPIYEV